ncbi:MAG: hypothetical protein AB7O98_07240, partial [Hyphomonadaceae bacterium]
MRRLLRRQRRRKRTPALAVSGRLHIFSAVVGAADFVLSAKAMHLYLAKAALRPKLPFSPRHFITLTEHFAPKRARWTDNLGAVKPGDWALVIRARGVYALGGAPTRPGRPVENVFDLIEPDEVAALRNKDGKLLLDLGWEGLLPVNTIMTNLAPAVEKLGIDPRRIFILHSNIGLGDAFARGWSASVTTPAPQTIAFPITLALTAIHHQKQVNEGAIAARLQAARAKLTGPPPPKRYAFFNGEPRPHRLLIMCHLAAAGRLGDGHISMMAYSKNNTFAGTETDAARTEEAERFRQIARKVAAPQTTTDAIDEVLAMLPISLDVDREKFSASIAQFESIAWNSQPDRYYDESWFSLVADTIFFGPNVMMV